MAMINKYTLHLLSESQFLYGMTDIYDWALIENINLKTIDIYKGHVWKFAWVLLCIKNKQTKKICLLPHVWEIES